MKVVVQRVKHASVKVDNKTISSIDLGYLLFVGFKTDDTLEEVKYVARKVANLRVFDDEEGHLNKNIKDIKGEILSISQFTLYGNVKKSNRPGFKEAMNYQLANELYQYFNMLLKTEFNLNVYPGIFGKHMEISLLNDGPVTIIIEKNKER